MTPEEFRCLVDAQMGFDPGAYQQQMISQLQRAGAYGHIPQDQFHETFSPIPPDIDSMKRANARVVETPKLK